MAKYIVTSPTGEKYEVTAPDTASPDEVKAYAQQNFAPKTAPKGETYDPTEGMSELQKMGAGAGKAFVDLWRRGKQIVGQGDQAEIDESRKLDAPLMQTGFGVVGNLAGNIAATIPVGGAIGMAAKGAASLPAAAPVAQLVAQMAAKYPTLAALLPGATSGAAMGAMEPVATGESTLKNVAAGAAAGTAGGLLPLGAARLISPNVAPDVQKLIDAGVRVTPGQAAGGMVSRLEQGLTSAPLLGDFIKRAQYRAVGDMNRAAFNEALAPIGASIGKDAPIGREAVTFARQKIGQAYDAALDNIKIVDLGKTAFADEVGKVIGMGTELGESTANQLATIVKNRVFDRMTPAGTMSADTMKLVESDLGKAATRFMRSADSNQQGLGDALREVQASLRRAVEQSAGPEFAEQLQNANKSWSMFTRVRDASIRAGSKEGVFSAEALRGAVAKGDPTRGKMAFAEGNAPMQDLAQAAENVLGRTVPDSGTPYRSAAGLLAAKAGGAAIDPTGIAQGLATAGLLGGALYSPMGRAASVGMMTARPESAKTLAELLRLGAPAAGVAGGYMGFPSFSGP